VQCPIGIDFQDRGNRTHFRTLLQSVRGVNP
jgi:hypothetical protein